MLEEESMIAAGIVLYNPEVNRLKDNIDAVINQVAQILIVDNCSDNILEIKEMLQGYSKIVLTINSQNMGIARGLNQLVEQADFKKYRWLLTLDQDSVVQEHLVMEYGKYLKYERAGMFTCIICDRNMGYRKNDIFEENIRIVERCITSASLINVGACIETGLFDERFFIDYVDFDMCYQLREAGYFIYQCNFYGMLHEMGKSYSKKIFGNEVIIAEQDNPVRYYYYFRNVLWFIRKHKKKGVIHKKKYYIKLYGRLTAIILFEQNKTRKISFAVRGMIAGYKNTEGII